MPTWLPVVISTLALVVSIWSLLSSRSDRRRELHLKELLDALARLESLSEELTAEVECILLFKPHSNVQDQTECHRLTERKFKAAAQQLDLVERLVPTEAANLFRSYKEWHTSLTATGYPVAKAENAHKLTDARVVNVSEAQLRWHKVIADVRVGCLRRDIEFWRPATWWR